MREHILRIWRRTQNWLHRERFDSDLAKELDFHLSMKESENKEAGLDADSAREAAHRELGNLTQARESSRETWMFLRVETWLADVRYASRVLLDKPLFAACAVLTLALGIGANAAIFTLIDALLLRGLPVAQADRIVQIALKGQGMTVLSYPLFQDLKPRTKSFSGMFSWNSADLWTGWGAQATQVPAAAVSGETYQTLGLVPSAGRLLTPADDTTAASYVAVISYRYWTREFARDPRAIGRTIQLDQQPFTIVGVTPANFLGVTAGSSPDVTITVHANAAIHPSRNILTSKGGWYISVIARLKPGVTDTQARAELSAVSAAVMEDQVTSTEPGERKQFLAQKLDLIPGAIGSSWLAMRYRKSLLALMCICGLVLLLACVNLASLSLSRVGPRQKELSVRLALGAGRGRLIRQLLTESMILSVIGTALGAALAFWATRGLVALLATQGSPLVLDLNPDLRVLAFLGLLAASTGLLFGAAPAIQGTNLQPNDALKQSRIGLENAGSRFQLGKALVAVQVGLSVLLMAGAFLFVQTLEKLKWQNTGFDRNNIVFLEINAENSGLKEPQLASFYGALLSKMRAQPLISSVTLSNVVPVSGSYEWDDLNPQLWPSLSASERTLYIHRVALQYFRTMGLRLLRGRDFLPNDPTTGDEREGILSASAARTYFPREDPLGKVLRQDQKTTYRIIGVADDATYADMRERSPRTIYLKSGGDRFANLVIRGPVDKASIISDVRTLLKQSGKDIRLGNAISLTEQIDQTLVTERLVALLATFFAGLAAVLVAIGLYGVVGYSAVRRTSEIGVRLALGATRAEVLWLVLRDALLLSIAGAAAGIPAAIFLGRLAGSMLYEVKPSDPILLGFTVLVILMITFIAGLIPAIRASQLDPIRALRYE